MTVSANGTDVGEWVWKAGTPPGHELVIPKGLLDQDGLHLEFRTRHPLSPAELGLSADPTQYGILISDIRLYPKP